MQPILQVRKMDKSFGATIALRGVDLDVYPGEIRGLIGENGSGKSTLTSIVAGMQKADAGSMTFKGSDWQPASMVDALHRGVGMVVQEAGTIPGISVAENLFLGETERFCNKLGMLNRRRLEEEARKALLTIAADHITPDMPTWRLDMQERKLVEVARVMAKNPDVLVIDETTTALSQKGRELLYGLMNRMKEQGKAVIFISHDLDEIKEVCDTLTVLRDGQIITKFAREEYDDDAIKTSMIGRELQGDYYRSDNEPSSGEEALLTAERVSTADGLADVTLSLRAGEVLGVGGLSECGMHTLGKALFGACPLTGGSVTAQGKPVSSPEDATRLGIGYVSKDRDNESLCLQASIRDNIAIGGLRHITKNHIVSGKRERAYVQDQVDALSIKCRHMEQPVSAMSGGNKQKVVFGKWVGAGSNVLLLDCPTRGVDIGVKQAMYHLITRMKQEGKAILIISEELAELIGMCDRLLVMKDGQIKQEFMRGQMKEADIIRYMI